jgi:methyltransferase-like protein
MNKIVLPIELTPLHWLIAYATVLIYILMTIQELKDKDANYKFGSYLKKYWASTLATAIMLPIILLIAAENFSDILPINNVTAALAGWNTNSFFKKIMGAASKKFIKKTEETE